MFFTIRDNKDQYIGTLDVLDNGGFFYFPGCGSQGKNLTAIEAKTLSQKCRLEEGGIVFLQGRTSYVSFERQSCSQ